MASIYDWDTTAANNATADADINWKEGQLPSTVNNSAREMMAKLAHFRNDIAGTLVTGGTGDAYTVSPGKEPSSYANGWVGIVRFDRANTGPATFQVGALASADLLDAEGNALAAGDIVAGGVYVVVYDITAAAFKLLNRVPLHAGEVGTAELADLSVTTAKIAASAVTPAKIDSTGSYTVSSLTASSIGATTSLTRAGNTVWDDGNFAARIAALVENTAPTGGEYFPCDTGQKIILSNIRKPDFESGWIAAQLSTPPLGYKAAHGLGVAPTRIMFAFKCVVSEMEYNVGDIIPMGGPPTAYQICSAVADDTYIQFIVRFSTDLFRVLTRSGGDPGTTYLNPANWVCKIFAWK